MVLVSGIRVPAGAGTFHLLKGSWEFVTRARVIIKMTIHIIAYHPNSDTYNLA